MLSPVRILASLVVAACAWLAGQSLHGRAAAERASWPPVESHVSFYRFLQPLFGRQALADVTWSRALIYNDDCHEAEHSDFRYLEPFLDSVIELDPGFKRPYRWAAYAVASRRDKPTQKDFLASIKYLRLGMKQFPDDYEYFWLAGLRYWLDLRSDDPETQRRYKEMGANLIERAMHKPNAPPDLPTLAATLRTKLGQTERARQDLVEMYLITESDVARKRILHRLRQLLDSPEDVDELEALRERFRDQWMETMPYAPPTLFVLLGTPPSPVIDFDELATERNLFGAGIDDGLGRVTQP